MTDLQLCTSKYAQRSIEFLHKKETEEQKLQNKALSDNTATGLKERNSILYDKDLIFTAGNSTCGKGGGGGRGSAPETVPLSNE